MARGVNKVILVGNLGADPETRYTTSGSQVTNVRLATSESWRDRQTGDQQERTEWHRVVFFGKLAEIAAEYLRKGSQCYVEGSIRTNKWQDQSGQDRYSTEIVANEMQMLGGRAGGGGGGGQSSRPSEFDSNQNAGGGRDSGPDRDSGPGRDSGGGRGKQRDAPAAAPSDDFDDDIPF